MSDCRLCVAVQSVAESALVRDALEKKELTFETMLTGMRDSIVLGWTLRGMQSGDGELCEEHAAQVAELSAPEEEGAADH